MKKINIILLLIGVFCFSCSDFLEEVPKSEMSTSQNFQAPAHAYNAVNSLYRNGAPQLFDGGVYSGCPAMLGNYMSGFFDNEYKGQEIHVQYSQQLTLTGHNLAGYLGSIWTNLYVGISRANNAITYIPNTPEMSDNEKNQLIAEARFFRAFSYYYLTRLFGEVPLVTEPYESLDNLYVARSSVADVYSLIEEDLVFAVNQGGLPEVRMHDNGGRITLDAAETLLADVYLTMSGFPLQANRYADAATAATNVINRGVHSLLQHDRNNLGNVIPENSAYNKIRKNDNSPEEFIYYREYAAGITNNNAPQWTYPVAIAANVAYAITNNAYQPRPEFLRGFDAENDLRAQEKQFFHTSITLGNGDVRTFEPTPYIWHDDQAVSETATSGNDMAIYRYADVLLIAAEAIAHSQGVTQEAVDYLTQVRGRAFWQQDIEDISSELVALSTEDFVEETLRERYRELVFEFKLWFDVLRTRTFPQTTETADGTINFVELVGSSSPWGNTFQTTHLRFPIPEPERQRNPSLGEQNPGY